MAIRILQALSGGSIGGTELSVLTLLTSIDRRAFECEVSLLDGHGPLSQRFEEIGIRVHDLSTSGGWIMSFRRFAGLLRSGNFDLLHLYGFRVSLVGRLAARVVRRRPTVVHGIRGLHVTEGEEPSGFSTRLAIGIERLAGPLIDAYIANSIGAAEFLRNSGIAARKFIVIPNGIDATAWHPSSALRTETPSIVCVANFRPIKRHQDLVEAVAALWARGVKAPCRLVGDGATRPGIEALVRDRELTEAVTFLGTIEPPRIEAVLQAADVFVLPSLWEGMPVGIMEAMAMALPVVGTDVPGIRELVEDGTTGFLVPPAAPSALAARLHQLLTDEPLRRRMGEEGRRRIVTEFGLDRMVKKYETEYARLSSGAPRVPSPPLIQGQTHDVRYRR